LKQFLILTGLILSLSGCAERFPVETPRVETPPVPGNYPQIIHLAAHPMIIHRGQSATLRWETRNTTEVTLEQAADPNADIRAEFKSLGTFPASGTLEVRPNESTTYVVSCGNDLIGCSSASVHIIVK
jgi:hypothetical protein